MESIKYTKLDFITILDSIADGVFTINQDKIITFFNKSAERITGITKDKAIGQYCFDVFHANICEKSCALEKTIKTGKEIIDLPINIINSEGKIIPISISTAILRDEKGKIIGGVETFRDLSIVEKLKKEITKQYTFEDIVSKNYYMQKIFDILPDIAKSDSTVLIEGPTGSGKELLARAIHNLSNRKNKPYVVVNCSALPDILLESELFGYVKGAFTDAKKDKPGRFAIAEGGTIFLDEIGDISPALQSKLLRVLEEKEYEPLGSTESKKANVRIIAATNKNLSELVKKGTFREDLYYRINVIKIKLPPLSQRKEDIPLLVNHFIEKFNLLKGKTISNVSDDVLEFFMKYDFPGNIRELENIIEHAFVLCKGPVIEMQHLPEELFQHNITKKEPINDLEQAQAKVIIDTLKKYSGNKTKTAKELNIHKTTLWRKIKKFKIKYPFLFE
jgi:PAS domain S-box-containing protein